MRRSKHVVAPLLASAAFSMLTACRKPEMQRCVDAHNVVVDDSLCGNPAGVQNNNYYHPGGGIYPSPFHWYYGGSGGYGYGSFASGGSATPIGGHSYASSSTVRGGFGSTHASSGHGGGE